MVTSKSREERRQAAFESKSPRINIWKLSL